MEDKVRIHNDRSSGKTYFRKMTGIGPAFGGSLAEAAIMTRQEALDLVGCFPMMVTWDIEPVTAVEP